MGLDVYLYKYNDFESAKKREREYNVKVDALWKGKNYDALTREEKDALREEGRKIAESLGLDPDGSDKEVSCVEIDSAIYPEHMFKIGYFRSSYNSGGLNSILRDTIKKDLYYIFPESKENQYAFRTDWKGALNRAVEVIEEFKKFIREKGAYSVETIKYFLESMSSPSQALDTFLEKKAQKCSFDSFSCKEGYFFISEPLPVTAVMKGPGDTIYLIRNTDEKNYEWYLQALEVTKETIQWVLDESESNKYYLHWSS